MQTQHHLKHRTVTTTVLSEHIKYYPCPLDAEVFSYFHREKLLQLVDQENSARSTSAFFFLSPEHCDF